MARKQQQQKNGYGNYEYPNEYPNGPYPKDYRDLKKKKKGKRRVKKISKDYILQQVVVPCVIKIEKN